MEIRYRTETCYGSGERDAVSVMVYETYELGNTDILQTLENGLLKNQPELRNKCSDLIDEMNNNGAVEDYGENEWKIFYKEILDAIQKETGIHIKYVLWLADKETVMDSSEGYGSYVESEEDIDAYKIGPIVLSELGYDGTLYGYEEIPMCLEKQLECLKETMTNIINESESDFLSSNREAELDESYLDVDNRIQEIKHALSRKGESLEEKIHIAQGKTHRDNPSKSKKNKSIEKKKSNLER